MIISMTGYGKGSSSAAGFEATVEAKSLNHRFLDIFVKLPRAVENREHRIREVVRNYLERGRLSMSVTLRQIENPEIHLQLNKNQVLGYKKLIQEMGQLLELDEKPKLTHILGLPDVFVEDDNSSSIDKAWENIEKALVEAMKALTEMRKREGEDLRKDLLMRVAIIQENVGKIEEMTKGRSQEEFKKLKARLDSMIETGDLDQSRLELEIALLADRVDVSEECTRLNSHNTVFVEAIEGPEPAGRKLNFLLQEMNREANTIGAKCNDASISHLVVLIKEEIEKLREQVQNVE